MAQQLSYDEMRNLILGNLAWLRDVTVFTPELLTAIFWEETQFRNMHQDHGPAVGFGQIEPPTITDVNGFFKTKFTPAQILADDNASVQITSLRLSMLFQRLHSHKMAALHGYAGSLTRPANKVIPDRWIDCERQLLAVHTPHGTAGTNAIDKRKTYVADADSIKRALKSAKANSDPDLAFPVSHAIPRTH